MGLPTERSRAPLVGFPGRGASSWQRSLQGPGQRCLSWSSAASRPGVLTPGLLSSRGTAPCRLGVLTPGLLSSGGTAPRRLGVLTLRLLSSGGTAPCRPGVLTPGLLSSGGTALWGGGCPARCRVLNHAAIPGSDSPERLWVLVTVSWGQS